MIVAGRIVRESQVSDYSLLSHQEISMLRLAITLFILALVAGVLGFGGIAGDLSNIAQLTFVVFIILFLISAVMAALRGRPPL